MIECPKCYEQHLFNVEFCTICGTKLSAGNVENRSEGSTKISSNQTNEQSSIDDNSTYNTNYKSNYTKSSKKNQQSTLDSLIDPKNILWLDIVRYVMIIFEFIILVGGLYSWISGTIPFYIFTIIVVIVFIIHMIVMLNLHLYYSINEIRKNSDDECRLLRNVIDELQKTNSTLKNKFL